MEEWKEHFTKLGGIEDKVVREREKNDSRKVGKGDREVGISKMEITKAIDRLKEGKAAGIDDIPSEVWKFGGKGMRNWVWEFCNRVWREEKWPHSWEEGAIVPLLKKGRGEKAEEYQLCTRYTRQY